MKKQIFALILVLVTYLTSYGQSVVVSPAKVKRGDTVTISYNPSANDAQIPAGAPSVTIVFTYSTFYDQPWKMPMVKKGDTWKASFVVGRFATFATFYLQSGEVIQRPAQEQHYSIPVFDGNKRVKSSLLHESYSLSAQMPKSKDLQKNKLALLRDELINNPNNYEAKVSLLNTQMLMAQTPEEKLKFRKEARKVIAAKLEENPTFSGNVNLVTMGYLMIGEKTRLDSVRKVIMERFPNADISKDLKASQIAKQKDNGTKVQQLEALLKKGDQPGEEGSEAIHQLLFEHYSSAKDPVKALYHAAKLNVKPSPYLPENLKKIAAKLTEDKIAPVAAIDYANKSLKKVEQWPVGIIRYFPEFGHIPSYVPDSTRKQAVAEAKSALLSIKAINFLKLGKTDSAKRLANEAIATASGREGLLNSTKVLSRLNEHQKAFDAQWKLLVKNPTDSVVLKAAKANFLKYNPSVEAFNAKVSELAALEIAQLTSKIKSTMMNKPGPELSGIVDLNGKPVTTEMMKGKVVVLDFWATWCVPCIQEMPYFHNVFEKYRNHPDVMFMVVNSGSNNTIADAKAWVKQNPQFQFPFYFNNDKNIGEKVGFTLIPTIAVIDKNGKMQFRTIGFEGEILEKKLAIEIGLLLE